MIEHLLYARHCSKCCTYTDSFSSLQNSMNQVLLCPYFTDGKVKAHRVKINCPRSQSNLIVEIWLKPRNQTLELILLSTVFTYLSD